MKGAAGEGGPSEAGGELRNAVGCIGSREDILKDNLITVPVPEYNTAFYGRGGSLLE